MSARHDYPGLHARATQSFGYGIERTEAGLALDEIDRLRALNLQQLRINGDLRAQVERDQAVIEAAVFWHRHRRRGSQHVGDTHLARVMDDREAALDSEEQPMRHPVTGRFMAGDCERDCQQHCAGLCGAASTPDEVNEAET